ncbi:MAG: DUF6745 domain-containing protein [Mycobacteriales bacterium]
MRTELTDAQRAAMPSHAQRWIEVGWRTGEADWAAFTDAAGRCYRHTRTRWPDRVVRVPSPIVGALAAPLAAYQLSGGYGQHVGPPPLPASSAMLTRHPGVDVAHRLPIQQREAVRQGVSAVVEGAVDRAVGGPLTMAVQEAVRAAVDGVLGGTVSDAVRDAVRAATGGGDLMAGYRLGDALRDHWHLCQRGQHEVAWNARTSFLRQLGLDPDDEGWEEDRAFGDAHSAAGWWWPFHQFVVVADRPRVLHLEEVGPPGIGSHRLHCETGPALAWPDGWALYYWHGTPVPADLIEHGWDAERILAEDNVEVRRCAIERLGWDRFVLDAGLRQVGPAVPDPGNPDQTLTLYDVPERFLGGPARVLLCTNGTPERDGTRRRFGLVVPTDLSDPVAAAAWTYDWPADTYRQLARRA